MSNLLIAAAWNRELSQDEIKSFENNPWKIFKPYRKPTLFKRILQRIRDKWNGMFEENEEWDDDI